MLQAQDPLIYFIGAIHRVCRHPSDGLQAGPHDIVPLRTINRFQGVLWMLCRVALGHSFMRALRFVEYDCVKLQLLPARPGRGRFVVLPRRFTCIQAVIVKPVN